MIINTVYFLFLHQYMKLKSINITQKIEGGSDCDNVILLSGGGGGGWALITEGRGVKIPKN